MTKTNARTNKNDIDDNISQIFIFGLNFCETI